MAVEKANEPRFSKVVEINMPDLDVSISRETAEISAGREILREWIRVARWYLPDSEVSAILRESGKYLDATQ